MIAQRLSARQLVRLLGNWRGDGHSYVELADSIGILARDGSITIDSALPAERQLAEALQVSRTTVAAAYQRLRERGFAHSRQGSGTVIRLPHEATALTPSGPATETAEIDLTTACPLPWQGLGSLNAAALSAHPELFLEVGYDTLGRWDLRQAIAERYTARGLPTTPDQIMVTLGAQHAVFLIARTLLRRGDRSLIEAPSYPHAREALAATGAIVVELPVGHAGYDAQQMVSIAGRAAPRLAYLIPDHHNPTGASMPDELRAELISALTAQGSYIIADETTAELTLGAPRSVLPFAAAAMFPQQQDSVLTVGSLGKTLWGGLRVGWIRATPELVARLEVSRRIGDLGTGSWEQLIALQALHRYDEILETRSAELSANYAALAAAITQEFPEWRMSAVRGGVSAWVDLGARYSTRLSREAAGRGVRIAPGSRFGSPGMFERFTRIPFAASPDTLREAVARLRAAWDFGGALQSAPDPLAVVI